MSILIVVLLSYLLGSIPFALILVKTLKGIDLRNIGSGNIGATNAFRQAGYKIGIPALILDISKGLIPVILFSELIKETNVSKDTLRLLLGVASICGHNWPVFLRFKGGKGMATSFGVVIGLSIKNLALAKIVILGSLIWALIFIFSGYVSLASVISAIFFPIFLVIFNLPKEYKIYGLLISAFALYRHKSNIYRLLRKEESRFNVLSKFSPSRKKPLP